MLIRFFFIQTLFFVLSLNALCQVQKVPIVLNYENSSGEKGITIFEYDGNSRLIKARWQLKDTSRWSANYYLYNSKNQLVEKYREFSDGITSSLKYEYNEKGDKVSEIFSRSDGVFGISTFEYNKYRVLKKIICNKYNGWFDGEIKYFSDEDNRLTSADLLRNATKIGTIHFTYLKNEQLKTEKWITPNWNQTLSWEYIQLPQTFTSSNVFIKENSRFRLNLEAYSFNQDNGGPSFFRYSEDGKLIQKTFERSDNLTTETFYEYDSRGLLTKSLRNYNNGKAAEFSYEFNKIRQLINRNGKYSNGESSSEQYFYNENGDLAIANWKNFDNWLSGELTFKHAKSGNIQSGFFKGREFDAKIDFEYDEFGNLSKITWHFSFDKTQSYQFNYHDLINRMYISE